MAESQSNQSLFSNAWSGLRVAVLIPCYNEARTIATVVKAFAEALPSASILVYDNNSQDATIANAQAAGAVVKSETRQGKGHVVRRMLADVDADIYILVDGDATYEAAAAPAMIDLLIKDSLDMVTGTRAAELDEAYPIGHQFGNRLLTGLVTSFFGRRTNDVLSGYRVFTRRFAKSFPALTGGFEIETEITVHALELGMPMADYSTRYQARPTGSESKLNTWADGFRILIQILTLIREERPLKFFFVIALLLGLMSVGLATPLLMTYLDTGLVPRFPTAILATGLMLLGFLSAAIGLVLDTVTRGRRELKRLHYLNAESLDARKERALSEH